MKGKTIHDGDHQNEYGDEMAFHPELDLFVRIGGQLG